MEEVMNVDRRSFFKGGIVATLFAGVPASVAAFADRLQSKSKRTVSPKVARPKTGDALAQLSMASFEPFANTPFTLRAGKKQMTVILSRVNDLRLKQDEIAL